MHTWEFPYAFGAEDGVDLHLFQKCAIGPMMKGIYDGSFTGIRMTVYVKHRTYFSRLYMSCIRPFRHFIVYPHIFRKCMGTLGNAKDGI